MKFPDSHEEFYELTDAYVDGELDPETEGAYLKHIKECAVCRERLDERFELLGRISPEKEPPADLHVRIISAVRADTAEVKKKPVGKKGFRRFAAVAAIAAIFVLMTVIVLAVLPEKTGSGEVPDPTIPESANTTSGISDESTGNADGEIMSADSKTTASASYSSEKAVNTTASVNASELLDPDKVNGGLLILSGVLAVAAFIAFLISLSSISASVPAEASEDSDEESAGNNAEGNKKNDEN